MANTQPQQEHPTDRFWQCYNLDCLFRNNNDNPTCICCGATRNFISPKLKPLVVQSLKYTITEVLELAKAKSVTRKVISPKMLSIYEETFIPLDLLIAELEQIK